MLRFAYSCYIVATSRLKYYKHCTYKTSNPQAKCSKSETYSKDMQWPHPLTCVSDAESLLLVYSVSVCDDAGPTAGSVRHGERTVTPRLTCQRCDGSVCALVGMACI